MKNNTSPRTIANINFLNENRTLLRKELFDGKIRRLKTKNWSCLNERTVHVWFAFNFSRIQEALPIVKNHDPECPRASASLLPRMRILIDSRRQTEGGI